MNQLLMCGEFEDFCYTSELPELIVQNLESD